MLSSDLKRVIESAAAEARTRGHRTLTLEHAVYVMAADPATTGILSACGARLGALRADLAGKLVELPTGGGWELDQAPEFHAALVRAANHAQAAGRPQVTAGGFLAAVLLERTTYAVAALTLQGVTRLDVVLHLSRSASAGPPAARLIGRWRFLPWLRRALATIGDVVRRWRPSPANARYEVLVHNDDYTKREFVVELLVVLFRRSPTEAETLLAEVQAHGTGCAGVYPRHEAEQLVESATDAARRAEYPLRLSIVRQIPASAPPSDG